MFRPAARYVLPEFTERTAYGSRSMDPYSKLLSERIVFLGTPVDETAASDLIAQFMYLEHADPDRPVSLYINSPGGSFNAMTAVYDTMNFLACDVETFCLGQASSSAAVLLASKRARPPTCPAGRPGSHPATRPGGASAGPAFRSRDPGPRVDARARDAHGHAGPSHGALPTGDQRRHRTGHHPRRPGRPGVRTGGPRHGEPHAAPHEVNARCSHRSSRRSPP